MNRLQLLIFIIMTATLLYTDLSAQQKLDAITALEKSHDETTALNQSRELSAQYPNDVAVICKTSYLASRVGFRQTDDAAKRPYFEEGLKYAKQAIQLDSTRAESNYVMALALGRIGQIAGAKEKIQLSKSIKHYAERTLELDSMHVAAHSVLGKWHLAFGSMGGVKKIIVNLFLGGVPKEASLEKALFYTKRALALNPARLTSYEELAKVYIALGDKDNAKAVLQKGLSLTDVDIDDPIYRSDMKKLTTELN